MQAYIYIYIIYIYIYHHDTDIFYSHRVNLLQAEREVGSIEKKS